MHNKFVKKNLYFILILLIGVSQVYGQNSDVENPRIGLVLSGGGARGFAHIGVIKVLEEEGIDVELIGGTSMGAVVGGLYSMGYSISEIEKMALTQDWDLVLNDKVSRRDLGIYEKLDSERYVFSLGLKGRKLSIPPGLVYGQNVMLMLTTLSNPVYHVESFSDLDKPFFCMATDLLSGQAIKLDTGNIALAIRASMSVPSAFAPVKWGPYYLVDGGIIDNFPAKEVKKLGADYLIGVDIQTPLYPQEDITNLVQVLSQSIFLSGEDNYEKNLELIDLFIKPEIDPFTAMDFNRADSLIARGERKARQMVPQIRAFLDSISFKREKVRGDQDAFPSMDVLYVDHVKFIGNKRVSDSYLKSKLDVFSGDLISVFELNDRINELYGTKLFHTVDYQLSRTGNGETIIKITVEEASLFDLNVGAHYNEFTKAALLLNLTARNFGAQNGRLSVDLVLGTVARFAAEYVVDNGFKPGYGVDLIAFSQPGFRYKNGKSNVSFNNGVFQTNGFGLLTYKNLLRFKLGYNLRQNTVSQDVSVYDFDNADNVSVGLFADILVDTYDKLYFPNTGMRFRGKMEFGAGENTDIDTDDAGLVVYDTYDYDYTSLFVEFNGIITLRKAWVIIPDAYFYKILAEKVPISKQAKFGGFQPSYFVNYTVFPGYDFMELGGHTAFNPRLSLRYNFWKKHYLTAKGNLLSLNFDFDKSFEDNKFYSGWQLSYSYYSPLGPVSFSVAKAYPKGKLVLDLNLGFRF
ncbi:MULTISPECIES: patatin-like phospholipase family protein [unclassified Lentimicrobium]|uniref:patatin-like phospholipase family protein n=1 Tax=unclassified Lentimicrobium TaxID=2677434 RepID=UPI001555B983|nr:MULTISPECIES: patatin-like phospholipase family protein [unclassified Lentimicrobium]NPD44428.1 hypothetical protein [Lentimicrobium sp. S6]NPD84306.1 hypothetical protein [Lentimicrobium sp. L6]